MILCLDTDLKHAIDLAERFRKTIEKHNFLQLPTITASFGVTSLKNQKNFEQLIEHVDKIMYKSKELGRNKVTSSTQS